MNKLYKMKNIRLALLICMVIFSGCSTGDMEKDYIYFTKTAKIYITGVYVGDNPVNLLINGEKIKIDINLKHDFISQGKINIKNDFMLKNDKKDFRLSVVDTLTKKELYTAPLHKNKEGVDTIDFVLINGKIYEKCKVINFNIEVLNFSSHKFIIKSSSPQISGGEGEANNLYAYSESKEAYFGGNGKEIITLTITDKITDKIIGTKKVDTDKIPQGLHKVSAVIIPYTNEVGAKLEEPTPPSPDPSANKVGLFMKSDTEEKYDVKIMNRRFKLIGVLGENISPNQWTYLNTNINTLIDGRYYVAFYKAGTNDAYLGGNIRRSATMGGSTHGTPLFPTDGTKGSVRSFFIYSKNNRLKGVQL